MAKDGFDVTHFNSGINRVFSQYLQYNRRARRDLLQDQADKLAVELQKQARAEGPKTRAEIGSLPNKLNYRIRRRQAAGLSRNLNARNKSLAATIQRSAAAGGRKHVTVAEEIQLRLRWAGLFQASGWITRYGLTGRIARPRGRVLSHLIGNSPVITLINETPGALEFARRTGYIDRAIEIRTADMKAYIARKMKEEAKQVSRQPTNLGRRAA